jgi:hypothetical protein
MDIIWALCNLFFQVSFFVFNYCFRLLF